MYMDVMDVISVYVDCNSASVCRNSIYVFIYFSDLLYLSPKM